MNEPLSPSQTEWKFVAELRQPEPVISNWDRTVGKAGEADLSGGIRLARNFPDAAGLLQTAYDDLNRFFTARGVSIAGNYAVITEMGEQPADGAFKVVITENSCRVISGNSEGVRRGIYYLEDLLMAADGPFLKIAETQRSPWVKNRISRCFFGPIKRPPLNRDELLDDVDYYPEEYLGRLAREGVNGLWLTFEFKDLCRTPIAPEYGKDAEKRLAKLRDTANKCLRYGIKTYLFCIEPAAWDADSPVLKRHPELGGVKWGNKVCFCPSAAISQRYLYEAVNGVFTAVPELGGMINISHGEFMTTCLSAVSAYERQRVECPACSGKPHWEILHASLSAMERGMRDAAPEARLISWLYMPCANPLADWVFEIPKHVPDNVILQFNFESGGAGEQLGKPRVGGDYWLSYVGPSERFRKIAESAIAAGTEMAAKIQVGCSHEVATVPFVPVPAALYRKYREMRALGVSSVTQCWYFGNYPGIMNKAAGALAFEDFSGDEKDFLRKLASPDWGTRADDAVAAWELFAEGYAHYPLSNMFQYYGPTHDGAVWPLYLYPVYTPLAPTWKLEFGVSGDSIGECLENHTLDEAITLCRALSEKWNDGVRIFKKIQSDFRDNPARMKDIGLAEALGIQFDCGYHILRFYAARELLFDAAPSKQRVILAEMREIVQGEIRRSARLAELCENDSRLGFHSEAEGYKYFPEKLKWRIASLERLLREDFLIAEKAVAEGKLELPGPENAPTYLCGAGVERLETFQWKADRDAETLDFEIECDGRGDPDQIFITLVTSGAHAPCPLLIDRFSRVSRRMNSSEPGCAWNVFETANGWKVKIRVPFAGLETGDQKPIRLSIIRYVDRGRGAEFFGWGDQEKPAYRCALGMYNPQRVGTLFLNKK